MGKGFLLTSTSVASLAEFTLSFIILIYLLSLKNKSKNAWFYIGISIMSSIYYVIAFINYSFYNKVLISVSTMWLSLTLLSQMRFAYMVGGNPFKREMYIALISMAI